MTNQEFYLTLLLGDLREKDEKRYEELMVWLTSYLETGRGTSKWSGPRVRDK